MARKKKGRIGSSLDRLLKEEGLHEEVTARAVKRVIGRAKKKGLGRALEIMASLPDDVRKRRDRPPQRRKGS